MSIKDAYNRSIEYLRVSVTDRCNLRCTYCMPVEGVKLIPHHEILHFGEIRDIVKAGAGLGIRSVRLTGGEPTVRKDLQRLIRMLKEIDGLDEVTLTTNGVLLSSMVSDLESAGLDRITISLDTLKPDRYREISRGGGIDRVMEGIEAALASSMSPVKLNAVIIPGFNEDEIEEMASMTINRPLHYRFIEFMPIGDIDMHMRKKYVHSSELIERLRKRFVLVPVTGIKGSGPARTYKIKDAAGTIGFISSMSEHFCNSCNRLRLSSDGWLRPCLFNEKIGYDIKSPLRSGANLDDLKAIFMKATGMKPEGHHLDSRREVRFDRTMSQIGG